MGGGGLTFWGLGFEGSKLTWTMVFNQFRAEPDVALQYQPCSNAVGLLQHTEGLGLELGFHRLRLL